jgi:hypothetical protein
LVVPRLHEASLYDLPSQVQAAIWELVERVRSRLARLQTRVCVTLGHDFHVHLAIAVEGRPFVILLRIERLETVELADLIGSFA